MSWWRFAQAPQFPARRPREHRGVPAPDYADMADISVSCLSLRPAAARQQARACAARRAAQAVEGRPLAAAPAPPPALCLVRARDIDASAALAAEAAADLRAARAEAEFAGRRAAVPLLARLRSAAAAADTERRAAVAAAAAAAQVPREPTLTAC